MLAQFTNQTKLPPVRLVTTETMLICSAATAQCHLTITQHTVEYIYNTFPYIIQYEHKISFTVQHLWRNKNERKY